MNLIKTKNSINHRFPHLEKELNISDMEYKIRHLWENKKIYNYDHALNKPTFSVDTPPPYVSAAHLHVGHAMSYTQAEIIVRYKRMQGYNVFYPMGFDDNGLPTERYVENHYKINKQTISRSDFIKLCIEETTKGAKEYEDLWRALGLSVDWELKYSTINELCRHTAQKSFLDLYRKKLIYRANEPVLWDVQLETSLAQADLESIERKGKLYDIRFSSECNIDLIITTSRPELIPACVALFAHPNDERYSSFFNKKALVPLFNYQIPILSSEEVDPNFGTGLMMVCTFGDHEDVKKWKAHKLDTRLIVTSNGKMNELAGPYARMDILSARRKIVDDLQAEQRIVSERTVEQAVLVGERSGTPVEFAMKTQWFINVLEHKDRFLKRASQLKWFPEWMKIRLDQWINGLKYDWNISRQRFYGVPFPVWYVKETGEVILADESTLPIDPIESSPPDWALEKYKGLTIIPETDVMDTWMVSSLTPLINANWAERSGLKGGMQIYPMDLRVQAFEIIRTWLFYTLVKSDFHTDSLPWKNVMISGWGLNEQGKKISKRDLEKYTDENGYNRYDPYALIKKYGADAVRYWASSAQLGNDLRFQEREIKDGRKVVIKLWNVARMCFIYMTDFHYLQDRLHFNERQLEDQWILTKLNKIVSQMTACLDNYDYATAREILGKFFWLDFCDNYLELIKGRFWKNVESSDKERLSAQSTLYESLRTLIGLFAPYLPYITEEIYQKASCFGEDYPSLHTSEWPSINEKNIFSNQKDMDVLLNILHTVRRLRTSRKISNGVLLKKVTLNIEETPNEIRNNVHKIMPALKTSLRSMDVQFGAALEETGVEGLKIDIHAYPEGLAPQIIPTFGQI